MQQVDMFGDAAAPAQAVYVVPYQIAVNTLVSTLAKMEAAGQWPWDPDMKAAKMERTLPKLLAVLPPGEAEDWRARFDAERARLDAAA